MFDPNPFASLRRRPEIPLLGCFLLFILGLAAYVYANFRDPGLQERLKHWVRRTAKVSPKVVVQQCSPTLDSAHNVVLSTLTLRNGSDLPAKDVEITCDFFAPSGTELGHATNTLYVAIPPRFSLTIDTPWQFGAAHEQTDRVTCKVTGAKQAE